MLDSYRDLIDELIDTPTALRGLFDNVTAPSDETLALVRELGTRDAAMLDRLNLMLRQQDAVLDPLPPDAAGPADDADTALSGFELARGELVSLLMNLTIRDWGKSAIGADGEETTVSDEVEDHVDFDEQHLAAIRAALSGTEAP